MRLENKVALISGGARGMGAAEAKLFASEGAKVVIGDILEDEGRKTAAEIGEAGGECLYVGLDVTSESAWQKAVAAAVARFGKLDILVNNAGIGRGGTVEETTVELWDIVLDVNTQEQYEFSQQLYEALYPCNPNFHITDIIRWYDNDYRPR